MFDINFLGLAVMGCVLGFSTMVFVVVSTHRALRDERVCVTHVVSPVVS